MLPTCLAVCPSGCCLDSYYSGFSRHLHAVDVGDILRRSTARRNAGAHLWCCSRGIVTDKSVRLSVRQQSGQISDDFDFRLRSTVFPPTVQTLYFGDTLWAITSTSCQLTDISEGLRTRPSLCRQHSDDNEVLPLREEGDSASNTTKEEIPL